MTYRLRWASPARRAIEHTLPEAVAAAVWEFAVGPLADNPHRVGNPLREPLEGFWTARRGQYRLIYAIDEGDRTVTVAAVDHRRDAYR